MKHLISSLILSVSLLCFAHVDSAIAGEVSLGYGEGESRWFFPNRGGQLKTESIRLTYIHDTGYQWNFFETHALKLELEAGMHYWRDPFLEDDKYGAILTPMWRYYVPIYDHALYLGGGIGITYNSDDELIDRKLGSRLLFEDRLELGLILFKKHRLSVSVNHYSNANIADINHGVNYYFVNYGYRFN
ncbi:acyloxyacyl hydrolase [Glaciecola siphonariae]|uniref:Acyloxyacyl hydrolase n=1 Tax=Glaciecola siphonariae TaxID=521012 RepID=A0ABV9LU15_9ALTE